MIRRLLKRLHVHRALYVTPLPGHMDHAICRCGAERLTEYRVNRSAVSDPLWSSGWRSTSQVNALVAFALYLQRPGRG